MTENDRPREEARCLDEGTLVAWLDGALDEPSHRRDVEGHLASCGRCAELLSTVEARSSAVGAWLESGDPPPPPREAYDLTLAGTVTGAAPGERPRRTGVDEPDPSVRTVRTGSGGGARVRWAAAAVLVLVLGGVAVGPARGWVADRLAELRGVGAPSAGVSEAAVGEAPATSFVPGSGTFSVVFRSPDTRGRLVLEAAPDSLLTVREPTGGAGEVGLTVRPNRLTVDNALLPEGDYRVAVPPSVTTLRLRIGPGAPRVIDVTGLPTGGRTVLLGAG